MRKDLGEFAHQEEGIEEGEVCLLPYYTPHAIGEDFHLYTRTGEGTMRGLVEYENKRELLRGLQRTDGLLCEVTGRKRRGRRVLVYRGFVRNLKDPDKTLPDLGSTIEGTFECFSWEPLSIERDFKTQTVALIGRTEGKRFYMGFDADTYTAEDILSENIRKLEAKRGETYTRRDGSEGTKLTDGTLHGEEGQYEKEEYCSEKRCASCGDYLRVPGDLAELLQFCDTCRGIPRDVELGEAMERLGWEETKKGTYVKVGIMEIRRGEAGAYRRVVRELEEKGGHVEIQYMDTRGILMNTEIMNEGSMIEGIAKADRMGISVVELPSYNRTNHGT